MKFPLVTRRSHRKELNDRLAEEFNAHARDLSRLKAEHRRDLDDAQKDLREIVAKLVRVKISPPRENGVKFRICVDFEERMVTEAFCHGDDQRYLDTVAQQLYFLVRRELATMNFRRDSALWQRG